MSDIQEKIDALLTPVELANELEMNGSLNPIHAEAIAAEVYQPLLDIIKMLADGGQTDKPSLEINGASTCLNETSFPVLLAENEALKAEIAGLRLSLAETLDAASAIARDDDLDWHHEALEKAAKTLRSK